MNTSVERPWTVALACAVSLGITIWDVISSVTDEGLEEAQFAMALLLALTVIPFIFTIAAFFRRNWARIGLAVLTVLGLLSVPLFALFLEEAMGPLDAETLIYSIAEVIVLVLLFVRPSNAWYRSARAPAS
jgi:uncharacterized membrane protein